MPDYLQSDFTGSNDCTPVAAANVLGYWDAHGFPDLIDGSNSFEENRAGVTELVDLLKEKMLWTSKGTPLDAIAIGIRFAARECGYTFLTENYTKISWPEMMAELDKKRPNLFTMYHDSYGGLHSVAAIGYDDSDDADIVIVHDNWCHGDVFLNFSETYGTRLTTVIAPKVFVSATGDGGDGTELRPYATIQEAIDNAASGALVTILDGTYTGVGNRNIDFRGKLISLKSQNGPSRCIIDCEGSGRAFTFANGEDEAVVIEGFTIRNGNADNGGAIYCDNASPVFKNCVIAGNSAMSGGGVFANGSKLRIENCTIAGNQATVGGGVACESSSIVISNSIVWGNSGGAIAGDVVAASYCDIEGMFPGEGNFSADPLFAAPAEYDFHLKSLYGRWDVSESAWMYDEALSPCLDSADPRVLYLQETWPNGSRRNVGAYGNTAEASLSGKWWKLEGDVNDDCKVNIVDLIMVRNRLGEGSSSSSSWKADLNEDGRVNIIDLIIIRNRLGNKCLW